ncbi:MAG: hypothetical protein OQJ84_07835 [Xanthomonadales bacterium]|nr:hypothetical protein [Xanthomonadales bacterium]
MKKLLILPLLVLLTGCVSYYYPETAFEDGVYYAEDDPDYVVYSGTYTSDVYYPWYSLDYFYLGYYPSSWYSFAYGYPSGFSLGLNYGFSPWYYPNHHYGYYSPWYGSSYHHHYYPAWRPYRGYYSRHHDGRHDRYAGDGRHDRGRHDYDRNDRRNHSNDKNRREDYSRDRYRSSSVRRYVSTAPAGKGGDRGMVVRSRDSAKVSKSRLHVDPATSGKTVKARPAQHGIVVQPNYRVKSAGTEVRYRSNTKQTRSRTGPASPSADSRGLIVKANPINGDRRTNGNNTRQPDRASVARQAPVSVVSSQPVKQQSRQKTNKTRNNKQPYVVESPSKRSGSKQNSSRPSNRR